MVTVSRSSAFRSVSQRPSQTNQHSVYRGRFFQWNKTLTQGLLVFYLTLFCVIVKKLMQHFYPANRDEIQVLTFLSHTFCWIGSFYLLHGLIKGILHRNN